MDAVYRFRYAELEDAVERLQLHYERSGFARGSALFLLATRGLSRSDARHGTAIDRCNALLEEAGTPFWQSFILPMLAVLEAMDERFDTARAHLIEARLPGRSSPKAGALATSWAATCRRGRSAGRRSRACAEELLLDACAALRRPASVSGLRRTPRSWPRCSTGRVVSRRRSPLSGEALGLAPPGHLTSVAVARRVRAKALAQSR